MDKSYLKRWILPSFLEAVKEGPVVVVTGPRQVGKSTFLEHTLPEKEWRYLSLDDFDVLSQAQKNPVSLLADSRPLIIDEVQRAPGILLAIKRVVDKDRDRRFVLSGSANLFLMNKVTESLAGRALYQHLGPFTLGESLSRPPLPLLENLFYREKRDKKIRQGPSLKPGDPDFLWNRIYEGWLPVVTLQKSGDSTIRWLEGYITSYLERDLRQLSQIDSLADFRRFMNTLALRSGSLLNQTEIGRDISLSQPTVHRYVNLLEASHLLYRLPAYSINRTKQLMKTPKAYFFDSGVAAFLAGALQEREKSFCGVLLETAVYHHLRTWSELQTPQARLYYWRTIQGQEVDFILEWGKKLLAIEVKAATKPLFSHANSIRLFLSEYPEAVGGLVIHMGYEREQLDDSIYAIPFSEML